MSGLDDLVLAQTLGQILYTGAGALILLGLYAMVATRHLMRILLGLMLLESGVNLFLVAAGYRPDAAAPIFSGGQAVGPVVDPLPQALVLTAIVIGVGVLALACALAIRVNEAYATLDTREVSERIAEDTGDIRLSPPPAPPAEAPVPVHRELEKAG